MIRHFRRLAVITVLFLLYTCTGTDVPMPFNCEGSGLSLTIVAVDGATSCDTPDGSITAVVSGGEAPYSYSLNDQAALPAGNFTGLNAGVYTVTVVDGHQCTIAVSNVSVGADGFSITADVNPDHSCLDGTGSVVLHVTDGIPPYRFKLENGDYVDDNIFSGLQDGEHQVSVRDDNNCEVFLNLTVPHGNSGVGWKNEILPIVEANCAIDDCHNGLLRPDLTKYEKAHFYAASMKELTQDRSMPFDGSISQDQIDQIACWVDDGAPNN